MARRKWADLATWYYEDEANEVEASQDGVKSWGVDRHPLFIDSLFYRKKVKSVILDMPANRLEWKESDGKKYSWNRLKLLEVDGWRLPTRIELLQLYESDLMHSELCFWSSSRYGCHAWKVSFGDGNVYYSPIGNTCHARLVREIK